MHLKQARHAVLPAAAVASAGVTIWLDARGTDVDRDDVCPAILTVILSFWALIDLYYRKLTNDRQQAHAGHDVGVLAEGIAAYVRQEQDGSITSAPDRKGS